MKKGMVKIRWSDGVWVVSFGKNLFLETSSYIRHTFGRSMKRKLIGILFWIICKATN